ncbi:alpha/beta hydrolase [Variovorax sp. PCZ-1]|uniref:alpha/beta hydrolase n=1 Tax=Variovorax sp. PCZ-1 TaxID=2835533 RepID=UPI001BD0600A|nr:alpha/beta hydrolase [Variovorax sp. PCZ-1]MBS7809217.1 lysophospholipase [Variovorax sp. PCZ-1]
MESYLSPFTATDGENIAIHDWPLPDIWPEQDIKGTVIIVHGLGEHAFRYTHVAQQLNEAGFHVRAYDQYGHGESGGSRGRIPSEMRLVDDLADVVDDTRRNMRPTQQLILLGHSMGGLVVASFVRQQMRPVDGIILSSPALDPGLNAVQKLLLSVLPRIAPNLRVDNGLKVDKLSRDPVVVQAYKSDAFVHNKISGRLARFIADEGARCIAAAPKWMTPTLLIYAGADALVNPAGSRAFAANAPNKWVQARCFDAMYHEIFNDPEKARVFESMHAWLAQQAS